MTINASSSPPISIPSFLFYDKPDSIVRIKETNNTNGGSSVITLNTDNTSNNPLPTKILIQGPSSTHSMKTRSNKNLMDMKPASAFYSKMVDRVNDKLEKEVKRSYASVTANIKKTLNSISSPSKLGDYLNIIPPPPPSVDKHSKWKELASGALCKVYERQYATYKKRFSAKVA